VVEVKKVDLPAARGVAYKDVDWANRGVGRADHGPHRLTVDDIGHLNQTVASEALDFVSHAFGRVAVAQRVDDDVRPSRC
jgi:hypothetical protein